MIETYYQVMGETATYAKAAELVAEFHQLAEAEPLMDFGVLPEVSYDDSGDQLVVNYFQGFQETAVLPDIEQIPEQTWIPTEYIQQRPFVHIEKGQMNWMVWFWGRNEQVVYYIRGYDPERKMVKLEHMTCAPPDMEWR